MRKALSIAFGLLLAITATPASTAATGNPLWVTHVLSYPGGISDGVRAKLMATSLTTTGTADVAPTVTATNVKASDETPQDMPTDETAVAFNPFKQKIAIASANDFNVPDGLWIGRTTDGGRTWSSLHKGAVTSKGNQRCFGSDPSVVYSVRDGAFYVSTLCFLSINPTSEVQVWKSVDDGATWTPSDQAAVVITNVSPTSVDESVFYDKELLAVDNNPKSQHFGRLYVTFIKFHLLESGFSDFCPAQVGFTDNVPTSNPRAAVWSHTAIVPDLPQDNGIGAGANQFAIPVVDSGGGLDVAYVSEDCNTSLDRQLLFKRSTDGGQTFGSSVEIDHTGQFADNPNLNDLLPDKHFRAPISPSLAFNPVTGTLDYAYQNNFNSQASGADISFQQSKDLGKHWSNAKFISITSTGAPAPNDQYEPWLAIDENGNLHAIWYDNRNDSGNKLIETFEALSPNDGKSWTNFDISTTSWNPDNSFFSCGCFIGDYTGYAASNTVRYPVWTDGRNTSGPPLGETDIFTNVEIAGS